MKLSYRQRIGLLALLAVSGGGLLCMRLFSLQVVEHRAWEVRADRLLSGWRPVRSRRGEIRDAAGRVLAFDAPGFQLSLLALGWKTTRHECRHCGAAHYIKKQLPRRCRRCRLSRMPDRNDKAPLIVPADERDLRPMARLLKMREAELLRRVESRVAQVERTIVVRLKDYSGRRRRIQEKEFWFDYGRRPQRIRRDVPYEVAREIALHPRRNPAFSIEVSHSRHYPGGAPFAHILGRLGEAATASVVTRDDGSQRSMVRHAGLSGLEYHFDEALRGNPGWVEMTRDWGTRSRRIVNEKPARPGETIRLTIDAADQRRAYHALAGDLGAFVVLNAETGALLALATAPSYDPAHYQAAWKQWKRREKAVGTALRHNSPFLERAFRSHQPPGSIMKPFTALAAIEAGDGAFGESIHCERTFRYGGKRYNAFLQCNAIHGEIDLHGALRISCNVYFQTLMARMLEHEHFPRFDALGQRFGFGRPTGIEIENRVKSAGRWRFSGERHHGVLIASAIGQGKVLLSPAQMARAYAGLATGFLPRLHLVERVGGRRTRVERTPLQIPAERLEGVRRALRAVAQEGGSASRFGLKRYDMACKTGTAQLVSRRGSDLYNAWMAGFAPARGRRPAIAFAMVILRSPRGGADACGRRLEEFFGWFFEGAGE